VTFLRAVPFGEPAFTALRERIADAQDADPLAPVTVVVTSNYAGLSLRRELAREGLVNVRFQVLPRVVELLGAGRLALAGRRPLTAALRAEAIRRALDDDPGVFEPVAAQPGTEQALDLTFRELRELSAATLEAISQQSPRSASLVALFRAYRAATAEFYDHTDSADAAAEAIAAGDLAGLRDVGDVVLYLPHRLVPSEARLVSALAAQGVVSVFLGVTGDTDADAPARRMAAMLGATFEVPPVDLPRANQLVVSPDVEEEVRWVVRDLLASAQALGDFSRAAIVYPQAEPYARVVHEQLAAAGIPANGPSPRTLADSLAGRHLLRLLALREADFRREAVMGWLTSAPVRYGATEAPARRWDELSRRVGIVAGAQQWTTRLARFVAGIGDQVSKPTEGDNGALPGWRVESLKRDADLALSLASFIDELDARLSPGGRSTWAELAEWALELQRDYLGDASRLGWESEAEVRAAEQVEQILEGLKALDHFGRRATPQVLRQTLEALLSAPAGRSGPFGHGVFVAGLDTAAGMRFKRVYILGMVEGRLPVRGHEDPLLPDREREAAGVELRERSHEQRREFLAALAAAPERVLLYPRANLRGQRALLPSRWLTEAASALAGRTIHTSDFLALPSSQWLTKVHSFVDGVSCAPTPATAQERRMRRLALPPADPRHRAVLDGDARLRAGLEAGRARMGKWYTPWDGLVGPVAGLAPSAERPASPTSLEDWAACPMRYLLKHILHVAEMERPEEMLTISARDRGTLFHGILETFFEARVAGRPPGEPWSEEDFECLARIVDAQCMEMQDSGMVGKPLLWEAERSRIHAVLRAFLAAEQEQRGSRHDTFVHAEFEFGTRDALRGPLVVTLPGGRVVAFRGKADRVDLDGNGRITVYDYKSGKSDRYRPISSAETRLGGGERLQLPVYALAAREAFGDAETAVGAWYWFLEQKGGGELRGYDLDDATLTQFRDAVSLIVQGIEAGLFPARPGNTGQKTFENCMYCPYDSLCASDRLRAWERKIDDDALFPLHTLKGGRA